MALNTIDAALDSITTRNVLVSVVGSFTQDVLLHGDERKQLRERCEERLASLGGQSRGIQYTDKAVLANLDWGLRGLEEAIEATNKETKNVCLEYTEKMFQVCALLNIEQFTGGVPNEYLVAWANLYLAFLWKLRENNHKSVKHILDMFMSDPLHSRVVFAPKLWERIFLPHLTFIVAWHIEQRGQILRGTSPGGCPNASSISDNQPPAERDYLHMLKNLDAERASQLEHIEQMYSNSLDEYTRLYARHYKDLLSSDAGKRKGALLMPIAETPTTPVNDFSFVPRAIELQAQPPTSTSFLAYASSVSGRSEVSSDSEDNKFQYDRFDLQLSAVELIEEMLRSTREGERPDWMNEDLEDADSRMPSSSYTNQDADKNYQGREQNGTIWQKRDEEGSSPTLAKVLEFLAPKLLSEGVEGQPRNNRNSKILIEFFQDAEDTEISPGSSVDESCNPIDEKKWPERSEKVSENGDPSSGSLDSGESSTDRVRSNDSLDNYSEENRIPDRGAVAEEMEVTESRPHDYSMDTKYSSLTTASSSKTQSTEKGDAEQSPPKDFICPITGCLFDYPITLETGVTYERRAVQDWMDRGNFSCPITGQRLHTKALPKTNIVLKKLITQWRLQYPDLARGYSLNEYLYNHPPLPPTEIELTENGDLSAIPSASSLSSDDTDLNKVNWTPPRWSSHQSIHAPSRHTAPESYIGTLLSELKLWISCICTSEDLQERESSVVKIVRVWQEYKLEPKVECLLTKAGLIDGLIDVLATSTSEEVLRGILYLLVDLISKDEYSWHKVAKQVSELELIVCLIKKGFLEAVVLLCQSIPSTPLLEFHDLLQPLINILKQIEEKPEMLRELPQLVTCPRLAALKLLDQMFTTDDQHRRASNSGKLFCIGGISTISNCLRAKSLEERMCAVSILLNCIRADVYCRNFFLSSTVSSLTPVMELLCSDNYKARTITIFFLSELLHSSRREFNEDILRMIKKNGTISSMHVLLGQLQMAPLDHRPAIASLLLQLEILEDSHKRGIYEVEALDALLGIVGSKENLFARRMAAEALESLGGRFFNTGKSSLEAWLLKKAGFEDGSVNHDEEKKGSLTSTLEDQNSRLEWEKRVVASILSHNDGSVWEALGKGLQSDSEELWRPCMITAVWLLCMLVFQLDTGRHARAASHWVISPFVNILQSSFVVERKVIAALGLCSLIEYSDGLKQVVCHASNICFPLRNLKQFTWTASQILRVLINEPSVTAKELWKHIEVGQLDNVRNGEIKCLAQSKDFVYSGHSDGALKVWKKTQTLPTLLQDIRDHIKSITCISVSEVLEQIYSGSMDRTIRVYALGSDGIKFVTSFDIKDVPHGMVMGSSFTCIIPQGTGIKVQHKDEVPSIYNANKKVKSIALADGRIFCGCKDSSIQELDPKDGTIKTVQEGIRTFMGKNHINVIRVFKGRLYGAGTHMDGVSAKVWNLSDKSLLGLVSTNIDVQSLAVNDDFLYLGSSSGFIEVWLRERLLKVAMLNVGRKITSLLLDGEFLYSGHEDGIVQIWTLALS